MPYNSVKQTQATFNEAQAVHTYFILKSRKVYFIETHEIGLCFEVTNGLDFRSEQHL
jgi:hypothetical protein